MSRKRSCAQSTRFVVASLHGGCLRVCARWRLCGRHVGKVATVWTYGDIGALFRQITIEPAGGGAR